MSFGVAVLLGLIQGLTEFLPVSSSGHLALAQALIPGFSQPGVVFDAMLHVGTAGAVVWSERREIRRWLGSPSGRRLLGLLVAGTAATAVVAFPVRSLAEAAFTRPGLVGAALVVTGMVVGLARWLPGGSRGEAGTGWRQAALVGLAQGVAVFPGLSRSGVTIVTGLGAGLDRTWAARFSFLLGVPAIAGVAVLEVIGERHALAAAGLDYWAACLVGAVAAFVAGAVALRIVVSTLSSRVFHRFSWYCLPLGILVIVLVWVVP
ncbi:MAG: undecaprenyl-diphosphate phosphatase [Thermoanaerobaculales bacterium]|jgi:undecaprenyl-diphosphatase|nr:undecaprenyl-diphosphate phosphatase [Thermoanaerobaculales bacterium]